MLPFSVELQDGEPVSEQLLRAVRKAILAGQLAPGDPFPSVRTLSQELRMSPTTAHKVVARLRETGLLVVRPGIGMVVSRGPLPSRAERLALLQPACSALLREAAAIELGFADVVAALRQAAGTSDSAASSSDEIRLIGQISPISPPDGAPRTPLGQTGGRPDA
jgi:GntR family transcriptional regulator